MEIEFVSPILPLDKNICRICLAESNSNMSIQDVVEHELNHIKIIDILIFLNCVENNNEESWPQGMCTSCVSTALVAYNFKLNCLKVNTILSQVLTVENSPISLERPDTIDAIDINVVYQDHEYDVPLFSSQSALDLEQYLPENKELTPLPPVTEIVSTEKLTRKESDKTFACAECPKSFTRLYGLHHHMAKHRDIRKYLCSRCGKRFHTSNGLKQHFLSHKDVAQFKCGFCNKTYKSRQSLKEHFRKAHSCNSKLFVCVICSKRFTAKSTLMMHVKSHSGIKNYECPNCPKKYTRASYLKAHILIHSNKVRPKPFSCEYVDCERSFSTKHSLLVHVAHAHTTERPHKCSICSKGFATSSGLKTHSECHINKEIICNICGIKLGSRKALQKHTKSHDVTNDMILETVVDDVFFEQLYLTNPE